MPMLTVIVVAHNEATRIKACINSILQQTVTPDEIVIVAHNCTDNTAQIAERLLQESSLKNWRVDALFSKETGPIFPRIRGFELASHEYIACIDGDSVAASDWLKQITLPLQRADVVGVGGVVRFANSFLANLNSFWFFDASKYRINHHFYFWGANFSCKKSTYLAIGWLNMLIPLRKSLELQYWAEDCYLSLKLESMGKVVFAAKAHVTAFSKEQENTRNFIKRWHRQDIDRKTLFTHFKIK